MQATTITCNYTNTHIILQQHCYHTVCYVGQQYDVLLTQRKCSSDDATRSTKMDSSFNFSVRLWIHCQHREL